MSTLSALDEDPDKRAEQLDSGAARPTAEMQKPKSEKQLQAETIAATAAAIIGSLFSSNCNVVIGTSQSFDETKLFEAPSVPTAPAPAAEDEPVPGSCLLLLSTRPKSCDKKQ